MKKNSFLFFFCFLNSDKTENTRIKHIIPQSDIYKYNEEMHLNPIFDYINSYSIKDFIKTQGITNNFLILGINIVILSLFMAYGIFFLTQRQVGWALFCLIVSYAIVQYIEYQKIAIMVQERYSTFEGILKFILTKNEISLKEIPLDGFLYTLSKKIDLQRSSVRNFLITSCSYALFYIVFYCIFEIICKNYFKNNKEKLKLQIKNNFHEDVSDNYIIDLSSRLIFLLSPQNLSEKSKDNTPQWLFLTSPDGSIYKNISSTIEDFEFSIKQQIKIIGTCFDYWKFIPFMQVILLLTCTQIIEDFFYTILSHSDEEEHLLTLPVVSMDFYNHIENITYSHAYIIKNNLSYYFFNRGMQLINRLYYKKDKFIIKSCARIMTHVIFFLILSQSRIILLSYLWFTITCFVLGIDIYGNWETVCTYLKKFLTYTRTRNVYQFNEESSAPMNTRVRNSQSSIKGLIDALSYISKYSSFFISICIFYTQWISDNHLMIRQGMLLYKNCAMMIISFAELWNILGVVIGWSYYSVSSAGIIDNRRLNFKYHDDSLLPTSGDIIINDLNFLYPDAAIYSVSLNPTEKKFDRKENKEKDKSPYSLSHITFILKQGTTNIITGRNGSGKSTLLNIVRGLFRSYSGSISIGGVPIEDLSLLSLNTLVKHVEYFESPPKITYREILKAMVQNPKKDITDKELFQAIKAVGLEKIITNLDHVYKNLSKGQTQRLCVIPIFLFQYSRTLPKILILDECLSGIHCKYDSMLGEDEGDIDRYQLLYKIGKIAKNYGITLVYVAHDPISVLLKEFKKVDKIINLDQGLITTVSVKNKRGRYVDEITGEEILKTT